MKKAASVFVALLALRAAAADPDYSQAGESGKRPVTPDKIPVVDIHVKTGEFPQLMLCGKPAFVAAITGTKHVLSCDNVNYKTLYHELSGEWGHRWFSQINCSPVTETQRCERYETMTSREWSCDDEKLEMTMTLVYSVSCEATAPADGLEDDDAERPSAVAFAEPTLQLLPDRPHEPTVTFGQHPDDWTPKKCPGRARYEYRTNVPIEAGTCGVKDKVDYRSIVDDVEYQADVEPTYRKHLCANGCRARNRKVVYRKWGCDATKNRAEVDIVFEVECTPNYQ